MLMNIARALARQWSFQASIRLVVDGRGPGVDSSNTRPRGQIPRVPPAELTGAVAAYS